MLQHADDLTQLADVSGARATHHEVRPDGESLSPRQIAVDVVGGAGRHISASQHRHSNLAASADLNLVRPRWRSTR